MGVIIPQPSICTLEAFLTASPFQIEHDWYLHIGQAEALIKPRKERITALRERLKAAKPRSPEKAEIKNKLAETERECQEIMAGYENRWYETAEKIRAELIDRVTARWRGIDEDIQEAIGWFYEVMSDGRYFEADPLRWFKRPSREVLEQIMAEWVQRGELMPIGTTQNITTFAPAVPAETIQGTLW